MLRAMRAVLAEPRLDELPPVKEVMRRSRRRIEAELPDDRPFAPLTGELAARVADQFAASNATFVDEYFGGRSTGLFTPPSDLRPSLWLFEGASERELRCFSSLLEHALSSADRSRRKQAPARRRCPSPADADSPSPPPTPRLSDSLAAGVEPLRDSTAGGRRSSRLEPAVQHSPLA
jgi:hypothetical protein